MRRLTPLFLALGMASLLAGCADLPPLPGLPTATPEARLPPISIMPPLDPDTDVARAEAAWSASGIRDYTWVIGFACECAGQGPLEVSVIDGAVTHVRTPTKELAIDDLAGFPLTVDQVLRSASDATRGGGAVTGTWGSNGVPAEVSIDFDKRAIDDELSVTVSRFEPAP